MEYEPKTYFTEIEQDDVKGFTILATDEKMGYHVAEKWIRESEDSTWVQYWVPEPQLHERVKDGACKPKAKLSDEQYEQVCEYVGMPSHSERKAASV